MTLIKIKKSWYSDPLAFALNIALVYVVYALLRLIFLAENWEALRDGVGAVPLKNLIDGSLLFDSSAICYTNALYALMMLVPLALKESRRWQSMAKWTFVAVNSVAVVINMADSVYYQFTARRTTMSVFREFANDGNIGGIVGVELLNHWYLVLAAAALIAMLVMLYVTPTGDYRPEGRRGKALFYGVQVVSLLAAGVLFAGGCRGGLAHSVRPITLSNAGKYVRRPQDAALVLNTPFSLIRSVNKNVYKDPEFFTREELGRIFTPLHQAPDSVAPRRRNVVVLIVESLGREYVGELNGSLDGGEYKGYTPCIDSIARLSLTFDHTYANGRKSIDAMPSVLSSIPMFIEPFVLTPASLNSLSGIAGELGREGYSTAFFHGAHNGSMGFEAFANSTGFDRYFGRTEYNADSRFGGDRDFDGMWAVWDEEFLQFFALTLSDMKQPFMASVFTATSHHPFRVPERYAGRFLDVPGDDNPALKCVKYTDYSIGRFFETASKQPWFDNTLFVITADHTGLSSRSEYQTALGIYEVPLIIYDPRGEFPTGRRGGVSQQIDIMPTLLGYLGTRGSYVAYGNDLLRTDAADTWAVNYNSGVYQYVKPGFMLRMDQNGRVLGLYRTDSPDALEEDVSGQYSRQAHRMERELKAIVQDYMERMLENRLTAGSKK